MLTWGRIVLCLPKHAHVDCGWNWPISREKYLKCRCIGLLWELQAPSNGLLAQDTNLFEEGKFVSHFFQMISYFHHFFNELWFSHTILCIYKAVACTTYFELGEPVRGTGTNTKWQLNYTARHGETLRVFLDLAHFWPEAYLQKGYSFNISFNFMFFFMIRDDPSRSELIRPGLAIRVDPVRLLYLPLFVATRTI